MDYIWNIKLLFVPRFDGVTKLYIVLKRLIESNTEFERLDVKSQSMFQFNRDLCLRKIS